MVPSDLCPGCLQQVVRPVEQSQPPLMFGNRCLNSGQLLLLRLTVVINLGQCDSVPETVKLLSAVRECLRQLRGGSFGIFQPLLQRQFGLFLQPVVEQIGFCKSGPRVEPGALGDGRVSFKLLKGRTAIDPSQKVFLGCNVPAFQPGLKAAVTGPELPDCLPVTQPGPFQFSTQ